DPEERERLRRVFERGIGQPVGFVLPLQRGYGRNGPEWQTGLWVLLGRHLFLIPGDSAIGFRLPLQSVPREPPQQVHHVRVIDPMASSAALPLPAQHQRRLETTATPSTVLTGSVVRTAIAIEPRDGRVWVFLPPVSTTEDYVELITSIEDTAATLNMPVLLEG